MSKQRKIKYTDMCIWIDANAYERDCDEEKLFNYLVDLIKMLSFKSQYFDSYRKYEDFSSEVAVRMFMKIRKGKGTRIKSILNYLKASLRFYKVDFEKKEYRKEPDIESKEYRDSVIFDVLDNRINELAVVEFRSYLSDIHKTFRRYIFSLPYVKDKALIENIYISCVLSFISSITPDRRLTGTLEEKIRKTQQSDTTILYHLDKEYKPLIQVLVKKLRRLVCVELSDDIRSDIRPDAVLIDIYGDRRDET